jgi:predicted xylose isomerase-like sugar epimerase
MSGTDLLCLNRINQASEARRISSLRTKKASLEGIAKCNYPESYKLLHDTFHHYLSGETEFSPKETAMVTFQEYWRAR